MAKNIRIKGPPVPPTKWTDDFPDRLRKYANKPMFEWEEKEQLSASGVVQKVQVKVPSDFPTIEEFCADNGIHKDTFYRWVKEYPVLADAFGYFKAKQATKLANHGLKGHYNARLSMFFLGACTDYREPKDDGDKQGNVTINIHKDDVEL